MSMCLERAWNIGFSANLRADRLSIWIVVGPLFTNSSSDPSSRSHKTSQVVFERAMYSASMVERAMVGCLREIQDTGAFPRKEIYPLIDLRSTVSFAQSASQNILISPIPPNVMPRV